MSKTPSKVQARLTTIDGAEVTVEFPLPDDRDLVRGPLTYKYDGMATMHSDEFRLEERFAEAYALGIATTNPRINVQWRVHVICWAAAHCAKLDGDFVECGVSRGMFSRAAMHYVEFEKLTDKRFYLVDTYNGIPVELFTPEETAAEMANMNKYYSECYEEVKKTFAPYPNAIVVKGRVPEILPSVSAEKVAYLSIDMNALVPEMAALEFFWDKLVPGAIVISDDYGFGVHKLQKRAWDQFAASRGVKILHSPIGQGILIKP